MKFLIGSKNKILGIEYTYWGKSQWYKFRWNVTHIDLGIISFYNLPEKGVGRLFWRFVSILIKPLRFWYHKRYVRSIKAQIQNMEAYMNLVSDSDG